MTTSFWNSRYNVVMTIVTSSFLSSIVYSGGYFVLVNLAYQYQPDVSQSGAQVASPTPLPAFFALCTRNGLPVALYWNMPPGSDTNILNRTDETMGNTVKFEMTDMSVTPFRDSDLEKGHTYSYWHNNRESVPSIKARVLIGEDGGCSGVNTP